MDVKRVASPPVPPPPARVIINLSEDEARLLKAVCYCATPVAKMANDAFCSNSGEISRLLNALYHRLTEVL